MAAVSMFTPTSNEAAKYHAILNGKIAEGARSAARLIERIQTEIPQDSLVSTRSVQFTADDKGLGVVVGDNVLRPTSFAVNQIAAKGGVPTAYLRELTEAGSETWQHELAAEVLQKHYSNRDAERMLSRSVDGRLHGWLSDKYRRLDTRPIIDALTKALSEVGAVPYAGVGTDTRVVLKALVPEVFEPIPGEYMVRGLEWSHSDFGNGPHSVREFGLRVVCLNGMTRENVMREVHVGGRMSDSIAFSERTYRLDTQRSISMMGDVVRGVLGPAGKDRIVQQINAAQAKNFSGAQLVNATKTLPKATQKLIVDAFDGGDIINLPAGDTAWRASNAVSWIARHTDDAEVRVDLERLAGKVLA